MKIYDNTLSYEESQACIENGRLDAIVKVSFADIVDAEGLDAVNNVIDDFFPDLVLSDIRYEVVGFDPAPKLDSTCVRGTLHIRVKADTE